METRTAPICHIDDANARDTDQDLIQQRVAQLRASWSPQERERRARLGRARRRELADLLGLEARRVA